MRIWSLHPEYLDTKGLVAAWREALLAQKVLKGETVGYRNHPQLNRFKNQVDPVGAIAAYLRTIHYEASNRGYNFNENKIDASDFGGRMNCTHGQLLYEWNHLKGKLKLRDKGKYSELRSIMEPKPNPIFTIVEGVVEDWEITVLGSVSM